MLLTLESLQRAATAFTRGLSETPIPSLYGVTDGKAVGTFVESRFNSFILETHDHIPGNAARGIDFPDLLVDLKVTSIRQPQSSSPFRDATQKVYGLGYHLLVMVYDKADDDELRAARLKFESVMFIDEAFTADFQMTTGILRILDQDGTEDDIDAYLEEKNLPLDSENRRVLANRIMEEPPLLGTITISNALQWRLQYGRALAIARTGNHQGVRNLIG